ncbi:putative transposase [Escherichia coli 5-366-08_S4_C2]|nr:putative transposase [Escherichia coli 5-366-08_S4_C2]
MSIKNDGHYFCRAGGNRPDGLNEPVTYEQLTRIAEKNIRQCGLDSQIARCISELKASALLWLWYELAIHGAPQNNYAQAQRIDTDYQRLKKLIWPEGDS